MKNVLLFGARGHLARTKVIPALKETYTYHVPISRNAPINPNNYSHLDNIAFMSIPTHKYHECTKNYKHFIETEKPLVVLEKPHGLSYDNFINLKNYFTSNDIPVLYNDHYIAKDFMLNLEQIKSPTFDYLYNIDITLHEPDCVNDRLSYFEEAGIVMDMYQSHVLVLLSSVLSQLENVSRLDVLKELSTIEPHFVNYATYLTYKGNASTQCEIRLMYKHILINVSCGKMLPFQKTIKLNEKTYELSNSKGNPYTQIFKWIQSDNYSPFLNHNEVELLHLHTDNFI